MGHSELQQFIKDQILEIEKAKWAEGCRIHKDPGEEFVREWIQKHGEEFRQRWLNNHSNNN